jgi:D-xylose transport system permease protein
MTTQQAERAKISQEVGAASAAGPVQVGLKARVVDGLAGPWRTAPLVLALVLIWIYFALENPLFLSSRNLTNLSSQIAVSSLLALGLVFVLVVRQIDLSVVSLAAACGGIAALLSVEAGLNPVLAVGIALLGGVCVGVVQSYLVVRSKTPAFIVTLGGMFILNAVLLWMLPVTQVIVLAGTPLEAIAFTYLPAWLSDVLLAVVLAVFGLMRWGHHVDRVRLGLPSRLLTSIVLPLAALAVGGFAVLTFVFNAYLGVPLPAAIVVGVAIALSYIATQTQLGKHIYATGGNPEAARRAGIKVNRMMVIAFAISGLICATAGVVNASRSLGVSAQSTDTTLLLGALAAVVIGGVSLFGGRGGIWAVLLGGILMGSIQNGLQLMASSLPLQWTVQGIVLILAVFLDASISRHSTRPPD